MFSYWFRAWMPLDLGFEFILNTPKHKTSASSLVRFELSLRVVIDLLDLVLIYLFIYLG